MSYRMLLQNDDFKEFAAEIRVRLKDQVAITRSEADTVKLFRAQGAAEALESILEYPEQEAEQEKADGNETAGEEEDGT